MISPGSHKTLPPPLLLSLSPFLPPSQLLYLADGDSTGKDVGLSFTGKDEEEEEGEKATAGRGRDKREEREKWLGITTRGFPPSPRREEKKPLVPDALINRAEGKKGGGKEGTFFSPGVGAAAAPATTTPVLE